MNKQIQVKMVIIIGVVIAVVAFAAGTVYAKSSRPSFALNANGQGRAGMMGMGGQGRGAGRGGAVFGEILSKDAQSVTIKIPSGGSQIVLLSGSTNIGKVASGTVDDLVVGTTVTVSGAANADGSITAQSIQIRPGIQLQAQTQPKK